MARRKLGGQNAVNRMVAQRQMANFNAKPMVCNNEIEVEGEDGAVTKEVCGGMLWDKKQFYTLVYVPEIACQQPGGRYDAKPSDYLMCIRCGFTLDPAGWKELAQEAFNATESKLIVPDGIKPEDNGGDK